MKDYQKLYTQNIYLLNSAIEEFKKVCKFGEDDIKIFGFCGLNYYNRKFNWYVVHKDRWEFDSDLVKNIKECYKNEGTKWRDLLNLLSGIKNEALADSIDYFSKIDEHSSEKSKHKDFHFHFMNIYQSYPIDSNKYFDGIVYRNIRRRNLRLRYATAETILNVNGRRSVYPWLYITFYYENDEQITCFSCQECGDEGFDIEYNFPNDILKNTDVRSLLTKPAFKHIKTEELYLYYILPIVAGYPDPNNKEILYGGKCANGEYLLKPEHVAPYKHILFIPVYDATIEKELYGNFFGNITIPFDTKEKISKFIKKYIKIIDENLFLLTR